MAPKVAWANADADPGVALRPIVDFQVGEADKLAVGQRANDKLKALLAGPVVAQPFGEIGLDPAGRPQPRRASYQQALKLRIALPTGDRLGISFRVGGSQAYQGALQKGIIHGCASPRCSHSSRSRP